MVLARQLSVLLTDLIRCCGSWNTEDVVVILKLDCHGNSERAGGALPHARSDLLRHQYSRRPEQFIPPPVTALHFLCYPAGLRSIAVQ